MRKIVFACIHNAGRSQMAAALFNKHVDLAKFRAISAGTEPALRVHPEVQAVMAEIGIDLSQSNPQKLTEDLAKSAQMLITMGCGEKCPYVPGLKREDWPLQDPKGQSLERVREIRNEIELMVKDLIQRLSNNQ